VDRPLSPEGQAQGQTWTCLDCGVVASFDPPRPDGAPDGWAEQKRGWLCLGCRREEVVANSAGENREDRRTDRRRALTEFELLRDPSASDGVIARRASTSSATVKPVRARLREDGRLPKAE
jgi:hypothetical protein